METNVIRCTRPERNLHGALWKMFCSSVCVAVDFVHPASANDDGRESSRRGERSCPQAGGPHCENFPGACFLSLPECSDVIPQQRRRPPRRRSLCSRGNGGQLRL